MKAVVLAMSLLASLLVGCTATPLPTVSPTSTPAPVARTVTLADNGETIAMRVGERLLLDLSATYDWQVSIDRPDVLSRVTDVTAAPPSQGLYEARQPGQAKLSATGDPACRKAVPPCAAPSILFTLNVVVR